MKRGEIIMKLGVIGLGQRGYSMIKDLLLYLDDIQITAICDIYEDRCEKTLQLLAEHKKPLPFSTTTYKELFEQNLDAVYIATPWNMHVEMVCTAMESNIISACEVGGSYSIDDCWRLIRTYEKTNTPVMFMENCCYGRLELMSLNMKEQGLFGQIVHCEGGYHHDIRDEICRGRELRHYRLDDYLNRNCENYPTHELGPICKILDINKGNRMLSLVSIASKSAGLNEYVKTRMPDNQQLANATFQQGDIVTTIIKCADGATITLSLDTSLPNVSESRRYCLRGSKGMFSQDYNMAIIESLDENSDLVVTKENLDKLSRYNHVLWTEMSEDVIEKGHGGMDFLTFKAFIYAVKNQLPMPIDIYDMASWSCISCLSEQSIALGGMPVAIPDFTNGKYLNR